MKQDAWTKIIFIVLITILMGVGAQAESDRAPATSDNSQNQRYSTQFGSGVNLVTQGTATTNRSAVFNMLLGASGNSPSWPAYPRLWYEEFDLTTVTSNTFWHPKLMALNGGIEIEYKYGMKTTLVMMTSTQAAAANAGPQEKQVMEAEKYQVLRWDPVRKRTFPLIRPGVPMVGFCSFEMSLVTSNGVSGGFEILGAGSKLERTRAHGVTYTIFSKFFPIPGDLAVTDIFRTYCNSEFQKKIRAQAEENFVPVIVEQTVYNNPNSSCSPSRHDGPEGDVSCQEWFSKFDIIRKHVNVPRCETQKNGRSICVFKAKENQRCPLYSDRAGRIFDKPVKLGLQNHTRSMFSAECDEGLTCTVTKQPYIRAWGLIYILGDSFCKAH